MPGFNHTPYCVLVADATRARYFSLRPVARGGFATAVVEAHADLAREPLLSRTTQAYPGGADLRRAASGGPGRNDDASDMNWQREHERQFAAQVIEQLADYARQWQARAVVLVAGEHMLGLLRQKTDHLAGLEVIEFCRDLVDLDDASVHTRLAAAKLVPAAPLYVAPRAPR